MQTLSLIVVLAGALVLPLAAAPASAQPVCLAGTASPTGRAPCTPCPPGSSQPRAEQTSCVPCRAGFFAAAEGQRTCLPCPEGTRQLRRAAAACEALPEPCAPGSYSASGRAPCAPCPAGQAQNRRGSRGCLQCPKGMTTATTGEALCSPIAAGAPSGGEPSEDDASAVQRIRENSMQERHVPSIQNPSRDGTGAKADCAPGTYSLTGIEPCLPCPPELSCNRPGTSLAALRR